MELDAWLERLSTEIGLTDVDLTNDTIHTLLDLARDSAHEVERIAAPLTTYLVGVAVGRGASLGEASASATRLLLGRPDGATEPDTGTEEEPRGTGS